MTEFGKAILSEFLIDPEAVQINNGSYGSVPRRVLNYQRKLQDEIHRQPDLYFRKKSQPLWRESLKFVAEFLGAKPENLAFVDNATFGINSALKSIHFEPGEALLASNWTYLPLKECCNFLQDKETEVIWLPLQWPIETKQQVLDLYEEYLKKYPNIKVVLTDHITSSTAVKLPVKEIIELCHSYGKIVVIDGAHAPGQVPLNLEDLGADYYTGNLHKWLFSPRSCAVLYVNPKHHDKIHAPVTSWGYKNSQGFQTEFIWLGTRDDTACAGSTEGIRFLQDLGGLEKTSAYNTDLISQAVDLLTKAWGTGKFPIPVDMEAPFLRLIRLPKMKMVDDYVKDREMVKCFDVIILMETLWNRFHIQTVVLWIQKTAWVRISAQVFNSLDQYQKLADAILTLKAEEEES